MGYGKYYGVQVQGKEGYEYVDDFSFAILNGIDELNYGFVDKVKVTENRDKDEGKNEDKNNDESDDDIQELMPPETGITDVPSLKKIFGEFFRKMLSLIPFLGKKC